MHVNARGIQVKEALTVCIMDGYYSVYAITLVVPVGTTAICGAIVADDLCNGKSFGTMLVHR